MSDITAAEPGIVFLVGKLGLGNQMFIMAAAWVIATVQSCPLYIIDPPDISEHSSTEHNYNATIFKRFGTKVPRDFPYASYTVYKRLDTFLHPWNPLDIKPGTVLMSLFQYYPAIEPFEDQLRTLFLEGLGHENHSNSERTAFLHVRRGDYLLESEVFFLQPVEYYKAAVERLDAEVAASGRAPIERIVIHTDDPQWVLSQDFFRSDSRFCFTPGSDDELVALAQMATCHGGAICANSTFSWWGAFLGAHGVRAPVIVPTKSKWILYRVSNLFPAEWVELDY
jgi:hypothetical protein